MNALPKLFVFSLRKYMQAAKEIATCSNTTVLSTSKYSCHKGSRKRRATARAMISTSNSLIMFPDG